MPRKSRVEIGKKYGNLTVLHRNPEYKKSVYICRCDCGNDSRVFGYNLLNGHTKSCGCQGAVFFKHGHARKHSHSKTYRAWSEMHSRTSGINRSNIEKNRRTYKDRGIAVCERWESYENFLVDMGERPEGLSLDRIDNDKPYSPENCRWASSEVQALNKQNTIRVTLDGVTMPLKTWCEKLNKPYGTVWYRIKVSKMDVESALTTPIGAI